MIGKSEKKKVMTIQRNHVKKKKGRDDAEKEQQIITATVTSHIKKSREGVQMQVGLVGKGGQLIMSPFRKKT
jgi:hypothetical protein